MDTRRLIQPDQLEQIAKVYVEGDNLKGAEPRVTMTRRLRKVRLEVTWRPSHFPLTLSVARFPFSACRLRKLLL